MPRRGCGPSSSGGSRCSWADRGGAWPRPTPVVAGALVYVAYVEEVPGANTQGRTLREARENLKEALKLVLEAAERPHLCW